MPFASLSRSRLFYTDDGTAAPCLVLIHGWSCDSSDWVWQIPALSPRFRVIAVDLRGHGRSVATDGDYAPSDFAADIRELLHALRVGPVILAGHSMGAVVAMVLGSSMPHAVRGIVAVDPSYGISDLELDDARRLIAEMRRRPPADVAAGAIRDWAGSHASPGLVEWLSRRTLGVPPEVLCRSLEILFDRDHGLCARPAAERLVRRTACPQLVFRVASEAANWDISTFAHSRSRSIVWADCGHWMHIERHREFNDELINWCLSLTAHTSPRNAQRGMIDT